MARFGTVQSGSFVGGVAGGVWTEIHDVLIPEMTTYTGTAPVRVPPNAGKWEGHIVSTTYPHLRIDLQGLTEPRTYDQVTWATGSAAQRGDASPIRFANWQVQFGPHGKSRIAFAARRTLTGAQLQDHKGSIAGVHMALANDFTIADIQRAFQISYDANVGSGNAFGLLAPTGAYTEPVVEVDKRWILDLKCKLRTCAASRAFKVNFAKKEGRFADKASVDLFLGNALSQFTCPGCSARYTLQLVGEDYLTDQATSVRPNWTYNFDIDSYTMARR